MILFQQYLEQMPKLALFFKVCSTLEFFTHYHYNSSNASPAPWREGCPLLLFIILSML